MRVKLKLIEAVVLLIILMLTLDKSYLKEHHPGENFCFSKNVTERSYCIQIYAHLFLYKEIE